MESVNGLRKQVLEVGKKYAAAAKNATTKAEAIQATEEGTKIITDIVTAVSKGPLRQCIQCVVVGGMAPSVGQHPTSQFT